MSPAYAIVVLSFSLTPLWSIAAEPVLRVVTPDSSGKSLLLNGGFEQHREGQALAWRPGPKGFRLAPGEGRAGSTAIVCENRSGEGWFGAAQTVTLDRTNVAPIVVRGWSKGENVSGGADNDYSLYVDLTYADGTPLWGQTGNFRCGTHDWEKREFTIIPTKPVKSLTLHCLFRGHAGKIWFDDVSVAEVRAEGGAVLFQGVPVIKPQSSGRPGLTSLTSVATDDGLDFLVSQDEMVGLKVGDRSLFTPAPSGFLLRDVAADSGFFNFESNVCRALASKLSVRYVSDGPQITIEGRLSDTSGQDRAVTLAFALPFDATGWRWGDDIRHSRVIQGNGEFVNQIAVRCGATGTQSLYPLASVWDERTGLALALDMAKPAVFRVGYHAGLKLLFIAYDFGLVKDTAQFASGADFRFVIYRFDPAWGVRSAWQRYMEIFPDYFTVRAKEQGLWMPFTDVSTVEGWEDFQFKFHEGNNNVPWDDEHGILSFRYTEPMTWWMRMAKGLPRTAAEALRVRDELAARGDASQRRMAEVSQTAAMFDEAGQPALLFRDTPWCDGAVWSLNPNPYLHPKPAGTHSTASRESTKDGGAVERAPANAATVHWNPAIRDRLYGPTANGRLDGEYLDSLEGYVTAELNFRREHFRDSTVPLTFSTDTKQPALFKGLAVFEFTKWISDDVHRMGKLMFANGVPYRFTFLSPWLDVLGTETDWLRNGKYAPASEATMNLWRTASGAKPYLLLMNTDYDKFTPDLVEKYFQRALFYGMWPGFFSHNAADNPYWRTPKWYNRDRPLFRKYIPIIKQVAEAGWQPVTHATCDNERIWIERFGPDTSGAVFLTLHNDSTQVQSGSLRPDLRTLDPKAGWQAHELLSGQSPTTDGGTFSISLNPQQTKVVRLRQ